jgi:predicted lipoprotein
VNWRSALVGLVVFATVAAACGSERDATASRSEVFGNVARNIAVPSYERLAESTAALATAVTAACASPTPENAKGAREAWEAAWQAWSRTRAFRFGPVFRGRTASNLDFMPNPAKIDALVAGASPDLGPPFAAAGLAESGADIRGLQTIEYLLFAPTLDPARCSLAAAAAGLAASAARDVEHQWSVEYKADRSYADQLARPKQSDVYANVGEAVDDLVNGMLMAATESTALLANTLKPPPGRTSTGVHTGSKVRATLWAIDALYRGSAIRGSGAGVDDLVTAMSPTGSTRTREALQRAVEAVDGLPTSLADARPDQLRRAYERVRLLTRRLDTEVASLLDVTINLSDSDGDS